MRCTAIILLAALTACAPDVAQWTEVETARKDNDIDWVQWTHQVRFPVGDNRVLPDERARLNVFLSEVSQGYADRIFIGAGSDSGSRQRAQEIATYLGSLRLKPRIVPATDRAADSITVTVGRYVVTPPDCPDWQKPYAPDFGNRPGSNFGCATETNLGLMVADPGDLVVGRDLGPVDPNHASDAVRRYHLDKVKELPTKDTNTKKTDGGGE